MESPAPVVFLERESARWILGALVLVLFAIGNLPWHLDDYDQAKQAFTSFEMVEQGHWLYQHTPNGWVATKPPLAGWLSAGLFGVIRSWELAWRAPSFLAAAALLILIARAASAYGRAAALIAAAAFGLNLFTPRLATLVRTDMPLALIVFAIGLRFWEKIRKREAWNARDRFTLFLLLTAAMLIKGPIVYAFLLPGTALFFWRARAFSERVGVWSGWWPWIASLALFVAWIAGGIVFVPEFLEHVVLREFAGRFGGAVHRAQPFYFYLPHLLHRFAPWSILLLLFAALAARESRSTFREKLHALSPETFWLVVWSLGGLLMMSFVPSKRVDRIFPIVPPLCLLLAAQLAALQKKERLGRIATTACAIALVFAGVFTTGYAARRVAMAFREKRDAFALFGNAVRTEAAARHWQIAVVGRMDEGMLLYLRQTEFLEPELAVAKWNAGYLDGLVVPEEELPALLPQLRGATLSRLGLSTPAGNYRNRYIFLVCSGL